MLFQSPEFLVLLAVTAALYWAVPRLRTPLLVAANAIFYVASGWQYLLLFLAAVILTHLCALRLQGPNGKLYLWVGVVLNLLNLGFFKYTGFVASNLNRLLNLGIDTSIWNVILPVGISFYTFQLIAYLVDVYRREVQPVRSLAEFWVFISFFGQLIAGPIMRGSEFLPQLENMDAKRFDRKEFRYGLYIFMLGMVKKLWLSDVVGPDADAFFASWLTVNGLESWIAAWLFGFQIYFDFSAYSDMAVGIGHMFGLQLAVNFKTPYLSQNPSEFWRRWHITLSSWIRDYIYIPLGGSRKGEVLSYINLVVAMVISGFWHGASWTFIAWGLFHGLLSAAHRFWVRYVARPLGWKSQGRLIQYLSIFLMFQATSIGWVFFRAGSLSTALSLVRRMFNPSMFQITPLVAQYLPFVAFLALLHVVEHSLRSNEGRLSAVWHRVPRPIRALAYTAVALGLFLMMETEQTSFIYFRF